MKPMSRAGLTVRLMAALRARVGGLFGHGYRPERHYMRGPGPMCRRKACSP